MGQELLSTFAEELGSVTLIPDDTGGVFEIKIDDKLIWSRSERGRFPEIKELKQMVRDEIVPERDLGHVDKKEDQT
jgi:selenoprotein W-related protein